jgi:hypothetical protein
MHWSGQVEKQKSATPSSHRATAHPSRALVLAALALLTTGLLAACGGSRAPSASNAASKEQSDETKLADYARCMREHGFDAEVAQMPGGGRGIKIRPGSAHGPAAAESAEKACARFQPQARTANLSPQQKVEQEEDVQRFAKCMREHGIHLEASAQGGKIAIQIHGHPGSGPNPESPAFQQAQRTCQKLLPRGGP